MLESSRNCISPLGSNSKIYKEEHLAYAQTGDTHMAIILQDPIDHDYHPTEVELDIHLTNNDNGAVYDSGEVNAFQGLAGELYALPANQSTYASLSDLVADWNVSIRGPPTGEVSSGWFDTMNADASIDLAHGPFGYDTWGATQQTPNLDTMALTISIPKDQLELDGVPGYNPATDARVVKGVDSRPDAFVGLPDGAMAPGNNYHVVPEPTGLALMATVGAVVGARKVGGYVARAASAVRDYFHR